MLKNNKYRITKLVFVISFLVLIAFPLFCVDFEDHVISEAENRVLAEKPKIYVEGALNKAYFFDLETWFNDHVGFRSALVLANAKIQYYIFGQLTNEGNYYLGPDKELNYANDEMLLDYAHVNLKSDEELEEIALSYQTFSDYLENQGIQYYYMQCWDKHSVYPEYFMSGINQYGSVSKTEQVINALKELTTVRVISTKDILVKGKEKYNTYSVWGDPTHWTYRGSYLAYLELMKQINFENDGKYKVLQEEDYEISQTDQGRMLFGGIHVEDFEENFILKSPNAYQTEEEPIYLDPHQYVSRTVFVNDSVANEDTLLVIGDSYIDTFIIDDLAESFHKTVMVWGECVENIEELIDYYHPSIIVNENAERCDRFSGMVNAAKALKED